MLTAEELLAGASVTFDVEVPADLMRAGRAPDHGNGRASAPARVRMKPLTVHDLQVITRAAKENDALTAALMVQVALVEPEMSITQVAGMQVGLLHFLLDRVNEISGMRASAEEVRSAGQAPIARAAHILASEFGWTPEDVRGLTLGQVLLHLEMIAERSHA